MCGGGWTYVPGPARGRAGAAPCERDPVRQGARHCAALHGIARHCTALHGIARHCAARTLPLIVAVRPRRRGQPCSDGRPDEPGELCGFFRDATPCLHVQLRGAAVVTGREGVPLRGVACAAGGQRAGRRFRLDSITVKKRTGPSQPNQTNRSGGREHGHAHEGPHRQGQTRVPNSSCGPHRCSPPRRSAAPVSGAASHSFEPRPTVAGSTAGMPKAEPLPSEACLPEEAMAEGGADGTG